MPRPIYKSVGRRLLKWRPIATAPKTGEIRLLACPQGIVVIGFWGWGGVSRKGQNCWRHSGNWRALRAQPTHWMPVPHPPGFA